MTSGSVKLATALLNANTERARAKEILASLRLRKNAGSRNNEDKGNPRLEGNDSLLVCEMTVSLLLGNFDGVTRGEASSA